MEWGRAVALERYAINPGEWVKVEAGFVMVVAAPVFVVAGVLRLDGVVRVG